jgi:hypothetical protein
MPVPRLLAKLVDDAAIFPPGNATMPSAVADHSAHERAWYADLVGPLLCTDVRVSELREQLWTRPASGAPLDISVIVTGGPSGIGRALDELANDPRLSPAGVEIPADPADTRSSIADIAEALSLSGVDVERVYVEVPADDDAALDALAQAGLRAKLRTGGETAAAFPTDAQVARFVLGCLHAGVRFKCTAGLHQALRHTASATGFEHHGFLNLLLAVRVALEGGSPPDVEAALREHTPGEVVHRLRHLDDVAGAAVRAWFESYGSCSILEPVDELRRLGLLRAPDVVAG